MVPFSREKYFPYTGAYAKTILNPMDKLGDSKDPNTKISNVYGKLCTLSEKLESLWSSAWNKKVITSVEFEDVEKVASELKECKAILEKQIETIWPKAVKTDNAMWNKGVECVISIKGSVIKYTSTQLSQVNRLKPLVKEAEAKRQLEDTIPQPIKIQIEGPIPQKSERNKEETKREDEGSAQSQGEGSSQSQEDSASSQNDDFNQNNDDYIRNPQCVYVQHNDPYFGHLLAPVENEDEEELVEQFVTNPEENAIDALVISQDEDEEPPEELITNQDPKIDVKPSEIQLKPVDSEEFFRQDSLVDSTTYSVFSKGVFDLFEIIAFSESEQTVSKFLSEPVAASYLVVQQLVGSLKSKCLAERDSEEEWESKDADVVFSLIRKLEEKDALLRKGLIEAIPATYQEMRIQSNVFHNIDQIKDLISLLRKELQRNGFTDTSKPSESAAISSSRNSLTGLMRLRLKNSFYDKTESESKEFESSTAISKPLLPEKQVTALSKPMPEPSKSKSPLAWVEEMEKGDAINIYKQNLMERDLKLLQDELDKNIWGEVTNKNVQDVVKFIQQMAKIALAKDLIDLRDRLNKQFENEPQAAEVISDIMQNWDLIGRGVFAGEVPLTEERKQKILKFANEVVLRLKLKQIDDNLNKLENGEAVKLANEDLVQQYFPDLIKGLKEKGLPAQQQEKLDKLNQRYKKTLNRALIQNLLTDRTVFIGKAAEAQVVSQLKYDKIAYLDRNRIFEKMKAILDEMLGQSNLLQSKAMRELRDELNERAFEERLKIAKVESNDVGYVKNVIRQSLVLRKSLFASTKNLSALDESTIKHPLFKKCIKQEDNQLKSTLVSKGVNAFIKASKELKNDPNLESKLAEMQKEMSEKEQANITTNLESWKNALKEGKLKTLEKWYNKYQDNLVVELVQGLEDPQEVLLDGCCYAIVQRIGETIMKNPGCSDERLQADRVLPIDRFNQAYYSVEGRPVRGEKGEEFQQPLPHIKEHPLFTCFDEDLTSFYGAAKLEFDTGRLEKGGVMTINLHFKGGGGHATFMHIDKARGIYRIFDPNVGLLRFKPKAGKSGKKEQEDLTDQTILAYLEMLNTHYTGIINGIFGKKPEYK